MLLALKASPRHQTNRLSYKLAGLESLEEHVTCQDSLSSAYGDEFGSNWRQNDGNEHRDCRIDVPIERQSAWLFWYRRGAPHRFAMIISTNIPSCLAQNTLARAGLSCGTRLQMEVLPN
jgi:hypothetical protein